MHVQKNYFDMSFIGTVAALLLISILTILGMPIYKDYLTREHTWQTIQELSKYTIRPLDYYLKDAPPIDYRHFYNIPKQIHLIWLGGPIPSKYVANIKQLTMLASKGSPNYAINIWTDEASRDANGSMLKQITDLRVRDIHEMISKVLDEHVYTEADKNNFMQWIKLEYKAPANYAALSDLSRIEILRQEGGLYLDTDVLLNHKHIKNFANNINSLFIEVAKDGGFACIRNGYITNNNIIIATNEAAGSMRLKALILYMINSMSDEYLNATQELFKDEHGYVMAKKSTSLMRTLTIAEGPYKLGQLANHWIPQSKYPNAPGLAIMEKLFLCYKNDNNWLKD